MCCAQFNVRPLSENIRRKNVADAHGRGGFWGESGTRVLCARGKYDSINGVLLGSCARAKCQFCRHLIGMAATQKRQK